jgi:Ca2+-binding EF-hand superfamily protein
MKTSRFLLAGAVAALLPIAGAMAQTPSEPAPPPQKGATFESLDTDSDGKISKAEAAANSDVSAQFTRYDQNADGFIERAEVTSANQAPAGETPQQ